jgi:hypothetical protein
MAGKSKTVLRAGAIVAAGFMATCNGSGPPEQERLGEAGEAAGISTANLELTELTNSCGTNQEQNFFSVKNNGTSSIQASDVSIKFWVDDTSAAAMQGAVYTGGCLTNASGCFHQVSGVSISVVKMATACGPTPTQQANWEVTISNTDHTAIAPGVNWTNIQAALHLSNYGNFSPGTADWYSGCLPGSSYVDPAHSALYVQGNLVVASAGVPPSCVAPSFTQPVPGEVAPNVANGTFPLVGPLPGNTPMTVAVALPWTNTTALSTLIDALYDPTSPQYQQYLTPTQFAAQFGPTQSDYDALTTYATSNGLTVSGTYTSRGLLSLTGPASAVAKAFAVTLNQYKRADGSIFYGPANDPSINTTVPVMRISGLDNYAMPVPADGSSLDTTNCQNATPMVHPYVGADFRRAYLNGANSTSVPSVALDGTGQTVALIEFDDYVLSGGGFVSDPETYAATFHLGTPHLTPIYVHPTTSWTPTGFEQEVATDIEMVLAMAPASNVRIYQWNTAGGAANQMSSAAVVTIMTQIANEPSANFAQVISNSWTWQAGGSTIDPTFANVLQQHAAQGQTFVQAAGDKGAFNAASPVGAPEPVNLSPLMTVVGGTILTSGPNATSPYSETVWSDQVHGKASGGGVCTAYPNGAGGTEPALAIPRYQQGVTPWVTTANPDLSTTNRMIPDVSMVATEIEVFFGGTGVPGSNATPNDCRAGTSAATALWAGTAALLNQNRQLANVFAKPIGFANPTLYGLANAQGKYTTNFNDINDGLKNGTTAGAGYASTQGYDLATGLGSPSAGLLGTLPPQACQGGSNLTLLVNGTSVLSYIPNGSWRETNPGIQVMRLEPSAGSPFTIDTNDGDAVNTCAGNSLTGQVICTGNMNHLYLIDSIANPTMIAKTMSIPAATNIEQFSGGTCITCNVAVDPVLNQAFVSIGTSPTTAGIQVIDLAKFAAGDTTGALLGLANLNGATAATSEAITTDSTRGFVLSANETNNFQIVNTAGVTFDYQQTIAQTSPLSPSMLDATAVDCSTGIALASVEWGNQVFLVDLAQASFPGSGTTWQAGRCATADTKLCASNLDCPAADCNPFAGTNVVSFPGIGPTATAPYVYFGGIAVTSNNDPTKAANLRHLGAVTDEFGGNDLVIFRLPGSSGATAGTPAMQDYVAIKIPGPVGGPAFAGGWDPHTLAVYTSPNAGAKQYAVLQNDATQDGLGARSYLAVVDMEAIITAAAGTHAVSAGTLTSAIQYVTQNP